MIVKCQPTPIQSTPIRPRYTREERDTRRAVCAVACGKSGAMSKNLSAQAAPDSVFSALGLIPKNLRGESVWAFPTAKDQSEPSRRLPAPADLNHLTRAFRYQA